MNDALLDKDMNGFWNTWRSKFSKSQPARVIDGYCDGNSIANRFADVFKAVCVPNSGERHAELCEQFFALYAGYDHQLTDMHNVFPELVRKCCADLKRRQGSWFRWAHIRTYCLCSSGSHGPSNYIIQHYVSIWHGSRCIWQGDHYTVGKKHRWR